MNYNGKVLRRHNSASLKKDVPPVYYRSWLHIQEPNEMNYSKYFCWLRNREIACFKQSNPLVSTGNPDRILNLSVVTEVRSRDCHVQTPNLPSYGIFLATRDGKGIKIRLSSLSDKESWMQYLEVVALLKMPNTANLLPGQRQNLEEVLQTTKSFVNVNNVYLPITNHYDIVDTEPDLPTWLYDQPMERDTASQILVDQSDHGNLLIRKRIPSNDDAFEYAVTLKEPSNGTIKHYKVGNQNGVFVIKLEEQTHPCLRSLNEVANYFENISNGRYKPLTKKAMVQSHSYEESIPLVNSRQNSAQVSWAVTLSGTLKKTNAMLLGEQRIEMLYCS